MVKYLFLLFCCFSMISCADPTEREVEKSFGSFYDSYRQHHNYRKIPRNLLSEHLLYYFDLAGKKEEKSDLNIKLSDYPSDKPDMIEIDVFSSLNEGSTEYKILNCIIRNDTARLKLQLKNTDVRPISIWNDECIMIRDGKNWKVDNFIFSKSDFKDTKEIFTSFLHFENPPEK